MSEILFIRHAETDMAGTFCGHSDPELNARGRLQLVELTRTLRAEDIGAVYTSDLRRCHATGIALAEAFNTSCRVRSTLREINFGQWEGLNWDEISRRDNSYAERWVEEYPRLPAPHGENFSDFVERILKEVKFLSGESQRLGRGIAIVTHAGVLRTVLCALHGSSDEEAWKRTKSHCAIVRHAVIRTLPELDQVEVTL
ncbi:MAG TPA: histidine phosphatase family protein [Edaphobacter sp.]|nr:histidine phosphatase family protein [Edaphobacter sp.]